MAEKSETIAISGNTIAKLDDLLSDFCTQTRTIWAILVTLSGQLLVQRGFIQAFDVLAVAALTCGVFNSTMELAHIVGETKFSQFLQEGKAFSVHYISVDSKYLLVSLFDDRTIPGVVKVASEEFVLEARKILETR
jgi:predicted regulator of Ras-like GTPase activity (Roadblock/LC7/MglB family)